jgi:transposase-like protein
MRVKICPSCNSPNVKLDQAIWWSDRIYYCKRCHYRSSLFPEIEVKNLEELKKLKLKPIKKISKVRKKGRIKSK